tara:strand:- start:831 stop:1928 length:1098 start_codon:yes stop_codon:yes gene_type:complete
MNLADKIKNLRVVSLFLFFIASISLLGSLLAHNYLVSFDYLKGDNYKILKLKDNPGSKYTIQCDQDINTCIETFFPELVKYQKNKRLGDCFTHLTESYFLIDGKKIITRTGDRYIDYKKKIILDNSQNKKINWEIFVLKEKDQNCIKNSFSIKIYKIFPLWYEKISELKKGLNLGSSEVVNPFFNGELSISNMVKRYPINYIFKSLLYLSSILMIFYWINYNFLFKKILNKGKNYFYYFGISSAIFLFFHVFFLGLEIENKIFAQLRRSIMIFFILSELLAQISLTRQLYKSSRNLKKYCHLLVIKFKIVYILIVSITTIFVLFLLIIYDFHSRVDYILEWNYFLGLLIFYFLSSIMWRKKFKQY